MIFWNVHCIDNVFIKFFFRIMHITDKNVYPFFFSRHFLDKSIDIQNWKTCRSKVERRDESEYSILHAAGSTHIANISTSLREFSLVPKKAFKWNDVLACASHKNLNNIIKLFIANLFRSKSESISINNVITGKFLSTTNLQIRFYRLGAIYYNYIISGNITI